MAGTLPDGPPQPRHRLGSRRAIRARTLVKVDDDEMALAGDPTTIAVTVVFSRGRARSGSVGYL